MIGESQLNALDRQLGLPPRNLAADKAAAKQRMEDQAKLKADNPGPANQPGASIQEKNQTPKKAPDSQVAKDIKAA
jgi:hypothetical protein